MSGIVPFAVGFFGLVCFVCFRIYESTRNERFFARARGRLDVRVLRFYRTLVLGDIPHTYRARARSAAKKAIHTVVVAAVSLLRSLERPLVRASFRMRRERMENQASRDPSPFLKDIKNGHEPQPDSEASQDSV